MEAPRHPQTLRLDGAGPDWPRRAREVLRAGGIVALPTETFYGLAVDPQDAQAVGRLLALKGYAPGRSLLLLAASAEQADRVCRLEASAAARALAAAHWPGPLTLVLPAREPLAACPAGTVAVRVPACEAPRRVAASLGRPVTGTSANPAGAPPALRAAEVAAGLGGGLALILDGGAAPGGPPSTLLDLSGARPRLLRAGAVPARRLEEQLGVSLPAPG